MKVCIIQFSKLNVTSYGVLSTVKAVNSAGHDVLLIGSPKHRGIEEIWEHQRTQLLLSLLNFMPDVVGFSVMTPFADYITPVTNFIKNHFPKVVVIAGGNHIHAMGKEVLEENPTLDYIYLGESEVNFIKFLDLLEKNEGGHGEVNGIGRRSSTGYRINNMAVNIEHSDILTYKAFAHIAPEFDVYSNNMFRNGIATVLLTRGCPYECTYCAHSDKNTVQRKVRFITPELFEKQLIVLKEKGVKSLLIHDAEFNLNKQWAYKIMDILKKHNVSLYWANIRIDLVTEQFIKRLKELDIKEISLPIESGSPRIRNEIFNRKTTDEQIYEAFAYAKKYNVICSTNVIVGAPTETIEDLEMTKEMLLKIDADAPNCKTLVPLPGTILFEKIKNSVKWEQYAQFDLAHDTEDTLFRTKFPKCSFNIDTSAFYEQFQLLDAIIHPLSIILRRNFKLQGENVLFFATCGIIDALEILKMFIVSKVKKIIIVLPSDMSAIQFKRYENVQVEFFPSGLFDLIKKIDKENAKENFLFSLRFYFLRRFKRFNNTIELFKSAGTFLRPLKNKAQIRKWINLFESFKSNHSYLKSFKNKLNVKKWMEGIELNRLLNEQPDQIFYSKGGNVDSISMAYLGEKLGFDECIKLNKEDLCFYRMTFCNKMLKCNMVKYSRKKGADNQRLYKKHIQTE